jgi:hypothetical protein
MEAEGVSQIASCSTRLSTSCTPDLDSQPTYWVLSERKNSVTFLLVLSMSANEFVPITGEDVLGPSCT